MSDRVVELIRQYRRRGLLIDTNILLLYIVGSYDVSLIGEFKRTRDRFVEEDYETISRLVRLFDPVVSLPNVLTEVSNLAGALKEPKKSGLFREFAARIALLQEYYVRSATAAGRPDFPRIGLTDTAIAELAKDRFLVLTDDFSLYLALEQGGVPVLNFNHIRTSAWRP